MSKNIALAGGMYGAYSGVGGSLQNSMQTSLSALSQAASILGGSVDGNGFVGSGNATSGAGNSASLTGSNPQSELSTSPLAALPVERLVKNQLQPQILLRHSFHLVKLRIQHQVLFQTFIPGRLPLMRKSHKILLVNKRQTRILFHH